LIGEYGEKTLRNQGNCDYGGKNGKKRIYYLQKDLAKVT